MEQADCVFCRIVSGQIPATKVYEDDYVTAFLDIGPVSDGHTLVVSKKHIESLEQCSAQLLEAVFSRIGRLAGAISKAMSCDGYNVLCNNGRAAGQVVNHLHFHIIPRKTGDGVFKHWPSYKYPEGKAERIADKIRKNL